MVEKIKKKKKKQNQKSMRQYVKGAQESTQSPWWLKSKQLEHRNKTVLNYKQSINKYPWLHADINDLICK